MIPDGDWETIVSSMPIPSVDLVVRHPDGGFVLGKRNNSPAKNFWFVPGGRIKKDESFVEAVHRIAQEELGASVAVSSRLGVYQHFYGSSEVDQDIGKHYIATGFEVHLPEGYDLESDSQHEELQVFQEVPKDTHRYTIQYLRDANCLPS